MTTSLIKLNKQIISCKKCKRLVSFREKIATEKRKQYIDQVYWGKPITGYGDEKAKLLLEDIIENNWSHHDEMVEKEKHEKIHNRS